MVSNLRPITVYIYLDSKILAFLRYWYILLIIGWSGTEIKCVLLDMMICPNGHNLKALLRKNVFNDVTVFGVLISATSCKQNTENDAAVTSLRMFVFHYIFSFNWFCKIDRRRYELTALIFIP